MNEFLRISNRIILETEPPARILVCPWGEVKSASGDFVCDREGADAVIAAFKANGVDLVVDYEHQTLAGDYASPSGQAPAAAWIKSLDVEEGRGIWGNVEWTKNGAAAVASKEYRYLSPVTMVRKSDRRVAGLHSVSLTNTPAIVGMDPIANSRGPSMRMAHSEDLFTTVRWWLNLPTTATEGDIMNEVEKLLARLREMAGVKDDATAEATLTALKAKLDARPGVSAMICKAAGVAEGASESDVVAAISAKAKPGTPDLSGYVPKPEFDAVANSLKITNEKLASLESRTTDRDAVERIANAKRVGKLTDAMLTANDKGENYFANLAKDGKAFDSWLERTPVIAPVDGKLVPNSKPASALGIDTIVAHSDQFDGERMPDYERINKYAVEHKVSFEKAMSALGAL